MIRITIASKPVNGRPLALRVVVAAGEVLAEGDVVVAPRTLILFFGETPGPDVDVPSTCPEAGAAGGVVVEVPFTGAAAAGCWDCCAVMLAAGQPPAGAGMMSRPP